MKRTGLVVGSTLVALVVIAAVVSCFWTPYDPNLAIPQDRHLARGRRELVALAALVPRLVVQRHDDLLEQQPGLLGGEPAAQRPGGIGLVADDQFHEISG